MNLRLFAYRFIVYVPHLLLEFHQCDGGGQALLGPWLPYDAWHTVGAQ